MRNDDAKPPIKHELGGGYYYTCYWMTCNETVNRYWRYCPYCGTKLLWDDEYVRAEKQGDKKWKYGKI